MEAANRQVEEDLVVAVIDGSRPICDEDRDMLLQVMDKPGVVAVNKCDLESKTKKAVSYRIEEAEILRTSAKTGEGINELEQALADLAVEEITGACEKPVMANLRQLEALRNAMHSMEETAHALSNSVSPDLAAIDIYKPSSGLIKLPDDPPQRT